MTNSVSFTHLRSTTSQLSSQVLGELSWDLNRHSCEKIITIRKSPFSKIIISQRSPLQFIIGRTFCNYEYPYRKALLGAEI